MKNIRIEVIPAGESRESVELIIEGELTIANAAFAREQLEGVMDYSQLKITLQQVTNLDLSFIQLLLAVRTSAQGIGTKYMLEGNLPEDLQSIFRNAGFDPALTIFSN